jgi:hypothetical protein
MKTITIYTKSGHKVSFQTNVFKVYLAKEIKEDGTEYYTNNIEWIECMKKERGVSFEYVDYNDIAAITSDTSGNA